jgi:hypothetical protein
MDRIGLHGSFVLLVVDEAHIEIKGRDDVERVPDRFLDPDRVIAEGPAAEVGEKDYVRDPAPRIEDSGE